MSPQDPKTDEGRMQQLEAAAAAILTRLDARMTILMVRFSDGDVKHVTAAKPSVSEAEAFTMALDSMDAGRSLLRRILEKPAEEEEPEEKEEEKEEEKNGGS